MADIGRPLRIVQVPERHPVPQLVPQPEHVPGHTDPSTPQPIPAAR